MEIRYDESGFSVFRSDDFIEDQEALTVIPVGDQVLLSLVSFQCGDSLTYLSRTEAIELGAVIERLYQALPHKLQQGTITDLDFVYTKSLSGITDDDPLIEATVSLYPHTGRWQEEVRLRIEFDNLVANGSEGKEALQVFLFEAGRDEALTLAAVLKSLAVPDRATQLPASIH